MAKFDIYNQDGKQMIRRNEFPRFVGEITFGPLSDIENVQFLDEDAGVMQMAAAMREAGDFLLTVSRRKEEREPERQRIGRLVAELRSRRGMTQYELAQAADITPANVSKIERGVYNVSVDILGRLCDALGAQLTITDK